MIFPMKKVMFHMFPVDLCTFSHSSSFGIVTWLMRTKRDEKGTFAKSFPETWRKHVKGKCASQSTFLFGKASLNQVPELTCVRSHLVHLVVKGAGQIQINSHMWSPQSHANKSKCLYIYIIIHVYNHMSGVSFNNYDKPHPSSLNERTEPIHRGLPWQGSLA
jgi:hypothetical protein